MGYLQSFGPLSSKNNDLCYPHINVQVPSSQKKDTLRILSHNLSIPVSIFSGALQYCTIQLQYHRPPLPLSWLHIDSAILCMLRFSSRVGLAFMSYVSSRSSRKMLLAKIRRHAIWELEKASILHMLTMTIPQNCDPRERRDGVCVKAARTQRYAVKSRKSSTCLNV